MNKDVMKIQQDTGYEILYELNKLNDTDIKALLRMMLANTLGEPDKKFTDVLDTNSTVRRQITNQRIDEISISDGYDKLTMAWSGISLKREHGNEEILLSFTIFGALYNFLIKKFTEE